MPQQRPYFLSSFLAAFRNRPPTLQGPPTTTQHNKHTSQATTTATTTTTSSSSSSSSSIPSTTTGASSSPSQAASRTYSTTRGPASSIPVPTIAARRGSDSSSEGFRDVLGAEKWYIGGRTAGGEERFFQLGVVRRVRSNDGLSLDRLSL